MKALVVAREIITGVQLYFDTITHAEHVADVELSECLRECLNPSAEAEGGYDAKVGGEKI